MILAIETATEICSTALVHGGTIINERNVDEKNIHSERLLVLISEMLAESSIPKEQVEAIAVSIGPGSFTGLRIGLSTAKGLALALDIPIIAIPTLDGIAEAFRLEHKYNNEKSFCALIDAKREESFFAFYTITENDIAKLSDYTITLKNEILNEAHQKNSITVQSKISASAVGILAERKKEMYRVADFLFLEPLYIRDFVATLPKNKL